MRNGTEGTGRLDTSDKLARMVQDTADRIPVPIPSVATKSLQAVGWLAGRAYDSAMSASGIKTDKQMLEGVGEHTKLLSQQGEDLELHREDTHDAGEAVRVRRLTEAASLIEVFSTTQMKTPQQIELLTNKLGNVYLDTDPATSELGKDFLFKKIHELDSASEPEQFNFSSNLMVALQEELKDRYRAIDDKIIADPLGNSSISLAEHSINLIANYFDWRNENFPDNSNVEGQGQRELVPTAT